MGKLNNTKEAQLEQNLIDLLCAQHGQWTFRSDLKTEEDLWNNLRNIIEIRNKSELNDNMLTDSEFKRIRSEILKRLLKPQNGCVVKRESVQLFWKEIMV